MLEVKCSNCNKDTPVVPMLASRGYFGICIHCCKLTDIPDDKIKKQTKEGGKNEQKKED